MWISGVPREVDGLVEDGSRSLGIPCEQECVADKAEATTNSFQIAELLRKLSGFLKEGDRSSHVAMPCRSATGCNQCLRARAWRDRTVENQCPAEPLARFALASADFPEWIEGAR